MSVLIERRRSPRIDFHHPLMIRDQQGLKKTRNLGIHGAFVQIENSSQFKGGERIHLFMKLPFEKKVTHAKARVAHISHKGIGVEFVDLAPQDATSIERSFNIFRHTVPMQGT
ncbi:MAG: PilZ domain-containing protein [Desulfobacterales bacterium]|nr:PilZ domain-containing protein [Desulfobacterales bacterium]